MLQNLAKQDKPWVGVLSCPNCRERFSALFLRGEQGLVDHDANSYRDPALPFSVFTCPTCMYSGNCQDFGDTVVNPRVSKFIRRKLPRYLQDHDMDNGRPSVRYHLAALIAAVKGDAPLAVAQLYLNAARCSVVERDRFWENNYRDFTVSYIVKALDQECVAPHCRPFYCLVNSVQFSRTENYDRWSYWRSQARAESHDPRILHRIESILPRYPYAPNEIYEEDEILQENDTTSCC